MNDSLGSYCLTTWPHPRLCCLLADVPLLYTTTFKNQGFPPSYGSADSLVSAASIGIAVCSRDISNLPMHSVRVLTKCLALFQGLGINSGKAAVDTQKKYFPLPARDFRAGRGQGDGSFTIAHQGFRLCETLGTLCFQIFSEMSKHVKLGRYYHPVKPLIVGGRSRLKKEWRI